MNIVELRKKLLAAARLIPISDAVPYAFEKRIMARIASEPTVDVWALWSRLLWKAAAPCVAIMLVMSVWAAISVDFTNSAETLAADLESTVMAPLDRLQDAW
jgi:hypothetical protein